MNRFRAYSQNDVISGDKLVTDLYRMRIFDDAFSYVFLYPVGLQQPFYAADQTIDFLNCCALPQSTLTPVKLTPTFSASLMTASYKELA